MLLLANGRPRPHYETPTAGASTYPPTRLPLALDRQGCLWDELGAQSAKGGIDAAFGHVAAQVVSIGVNGILLTYDGLGPPSAPSHGRSSRPSGRCVYRESRLLDGDRHWPETIDYGRYRAPT